MAFDTLIVQRAQTALTGRLARRLLAFSIGLALFAVATPARAEGMNNFYATINGLAVAPTDPFYFVYSPPEAFEELPYHQVTGRIVALPAGVLMMGYRIFMAAGDLVAWPFWVFQVFSPEPDLFTLIPDVEYE